MMNVDDTKRRKGLQGKASLVVGARLGSFLRRRALTCLLLGGAAVAGCSADLGPTPSGSESPAGATGGGPDAVAQAEAEAGLYRLHRLTRAQYEASVRALVTDPPVELTRGWPEEAVGESGFREGGTVNTLLAERLGEAAEALAPLVVGEWTRWFSCEATAVDEGCVRSFIEGFGRKAYRRPVTSVELDEMFGLYEAAKSLGSSETEALSLIVESVLQAPAFLLLWEATEAPAVAAGQRVPLTAHQLAARLAFFLTGAPPDEVLEAAAEAGALGTPEGLAAELASLLERNPGALGRVLHDFHSQWLGTENLDGLGKNASLYPDWDQSVNGALDAELGAFVANVVSGPTPTYETLMTAPLLFASGPTASLYGVSSSSEVPEEFPSDPAVRRGLLLQAPYLASSSGDVSTLPPRRGYHIWTDVLCGELDVPMVIPDVPPFPDAKTTRQQFEMLERENPCASGCHTIIDPIGFAFENFGPGGDYRTTENGVAIDASGTMETPDGTELTFRDGPDLVAQLATLDEAEECYARHWFRYGFRRAKVSETEGALVELERTFTASGGNIRELLRSMATSVLFGERVVDEGEGQ